MTEIETRIDQVTVFRDGARVSRTGAAILSSGPQKVRVQPVMHLMTVSE
ncbi:MAG: hypothetical protein ACXADF_19480 [Candidatus Thorarchaeota archaeon]